MAATGVDSMVQRCKALCLMLLILVVLPSGVRAAPLECNGGPVVGTDAVFDSVGGPGVPDLVAWSVEWQENGLLVRWQLREGDVAALTTPRFRLLLVGYSTVGTPYVFAEWQRDARPGGGWTFGVGRYDRRSYVSPVAGAQVWTDSWHAANAPDVSANGIEVFIPSAKLYSFGRSASNIRWEGVPASMTGDGFATYRAFHGDASAPVAAVATPIAHDSTAVELRDVSPEERVSGSAATGYSFATKPGYDAYSPALCRPNAPAGGGGPSSCNYQWHAEGAGWFAARFDVRGLATDVSVVASVSGVQAPNSGIAVALLSSAGDVNALTNFYGNGVSARGHAGDVSVQMPLTTVPEQRANVAVGLSTGFDDPIQLPTQGAWWLVALASRESAVAATFRVSGSGITCGDTASGDAVSYKPLDEFDGGLAVAASPLWSGGASAHTGVSTSVQVRHTMLAFYGAGSGVFPADVLQLSASTPDGVQLLSAASDPICFFCASDTQAGLFTVGSAGTYTFGASVAASVRADPLSDWPALLWVDVDLP